MALRATEIYENPHDRAARGFTLERLRERRGRGGSGAVETDSLSDPERAFVPIIVQGRPPTGERLKRVRLGVEVKLRGALSTPGAGRQDGKS
jgi:hypothetical protein